MIELRNLSKRFVTKDGPVEALNNVTLTVNEGDIYGIIGMSGAGKSTLVRCINMLQPPHAPSGLKRPIPCLQDSPFTRIIEKNGITDTPVPSVSFITEAKAHD